ncbi:MAG TPA: hypothetical protein VGC80_00875, partial [Acetobacteraceae bacterium]
MRWTPKASAAALLLLLTACPSLPGPVAQLERYKQWEGAGKPDAIEAEQPDSDCRTATSDVCGQIFAIRARACLTLARGAAAGDAACPPPGEATARRLSCAAEGYDRARAGSGWTAAQLADFGENRARALYCSAKLQGPEERVRLDREA